MSYEIVKLLLKREIPIMESKPFAIRQSKNFQKERNHIYKSSNYEIYLLLKVNGCCSGQKNVRFEQIPIRGVTL